MPEVAQLAASVEVEGVAAASGQLAGFGKQIDATAASSESAAARSMSHDAALRKIGTTSLIAGGLVVAGMGLAIGATMRFDSAISEVNAVANLNERQLGQMRDAAIEAGQATVFSASEAAQAEAELAKAGLSTSDILKGGLRGALDLASAGQLELGDAAIITAQALNIFQLDGTKASHVADVLAAGANKSAADVGQLGDALRQGGLLAKQTGLSLEDTVGTLALFADNALIGSDAGTSLKTMLQRLTPQSAEAKAEMQRLGISAYDSAGQFIGLEKFSGNLRDSLSKLTPEQRNAALATIFGSDAVRAANLIYEAGPDKIRAYVRAVNDQGAASDMAGKKLDNLGGDIEQLSGSIETQLIKSGSGATTVLRFLAQGATDVVNGFTELPGPIQASVFGLISLAGVGLTAVGVGAKLVEKWREWEQIAGNIDPKLATAVSGLGKLAGGAAIAGVSMTMIGEESNTAGLGILGMAGAGALMGSTFGPWGTAVGAAAGAVAGLTAQLTDGGESVDDYRAKFAKLGSELDAMTQKESLKKFLEDLGTDDRLRAFSGDVSGLKNEIISVGTASPPAAAKVVDGLKAMRDESGKKIFNTDDVALMESWVARATGRFQEHALESAKSKKALEGYTDSTLDAADGTSDFAQALADADTKAKNFQTVVDSLLGVGLDAETANLRWRDSLEAVNKSLAENGPTLDINTEAGRNNREALAGSTKDALAYAEAQFKLHHNVDEASGIIAAQVGKLDESAHQMGMNDEQTLTYIEDLLGIPADVRSNIHNTAEAAAFATWLLSLQYDALDGRHVKTFVNADTSQAVAALQALANAAASTGIGADRGFANLLVQQAASGMVVNPRPGGTLINVGEAGAREVILPTNDDARAIDLIRQAGLSHLLGGQGGTGPASSSDGSSGGGVTVQVVVQGSVLTERQLVTTIHEGLLRLERTGGNLGFRGSN